MNINDGADYWRNQIGCNVIPVDSKAKIPCISWKEWQNNPISDEQHEIWKNTGAFNKGIAIITGKLWRGPHKDKYIICIDCDNKKGIDEFIIHCFPETKTLEGLSQKTIVEQHLDNKEKAHAYFIVEKPLANRGGINGTKEKENTIPAIEVKSEGKSYVVCSLSIHKDGCRYEIIGTKIPAILNIEQSERIEEALNKLYKKYSDTSNKNDDSLTPIDELFKEDFSVTEGNNRHLQLMRVMESFIKSFEQKLSFEKIKEMSYNWNQKHCQPPLEDKEFEKQWKCAIEFIEKSKLSNSDENKDDNLIEKKINECPQIFYYANPKKKKIGRYKIKTRKTKETGEKYEVKIFSNIIIDAIPKKIFVYKDNPLLRNSLERIKIIFESSIMKDFEIGPYDNVETILKELENRHLVINSKTANDALSCIINAHKENKRVEVVDGITTKGYYLLNGKIMVYEPTQNLDSELDKGKVKECIDLLNYLATKGWKNKNIFPTVLKWAIISPFSFSIKFNSEEWMPWLQLYGCGQTGKTTLGNIVLSIWNLDKRTKSLGFNNIDSVARFGHTVSKDTYPILINEVGSLSSTNSYGKYTPIVELLKHSVESIICRGKYFEGKNYQEILALSPLILTSNYTPPNDGSYNRRFVSIHFPEEEKKETLEQEEFKRSLNEHKDAISILGDFTARYIKNNPSLLTTTTKVWTDIAKEILVHFFRVIDAPLPEWIDYFERQRDAIDESSEKTLFELRAFLMNKINDAYVKNKRLEPPFGDTDIRSKLDYCLKDKLIPFISKIEENVLMITVDIMKELRITQSIENLTSLKDIGSQIGFDYANKNINGKKMRVLLGQRENFVKFIDSEIK